MNIKFSLFSQINYIEPEGEITIDELLTILKSKGMREQIEYLNSITDPDKWDDAKSCLPYVTFNAILKKRGNNIIVNDDGSESCQDVIQYNQITAMDFDHIPDTEIAGVRNALMGDPYVFLVYTTPSRRGLKALIKHDNTNPLLHWNLYAQLIQKYSWCKYLDRKVKDISRASYLSYDPAPYYNPGSLVFQFRYDETIPKKQVPKSNKEGKDTTSGSPMTPTMRFQNSLFQATWKDKTLMDYIDRYQWSKFPEDFEPGNRNNSLLSKAAQLYRCGVDYENALWKLTFFYNKHTAYPLSEEEIRSRVHYAYTHPVGKFGEERDTWLDAKRQRIAEYNKRHTPQ